MAVARDEADGCRALRLGAAQVDEQRPAPAALDEPLYLVWGSRRGRVTGFEALDLRQADEVGEAREGQRAVVVRRAAAPQARQRLLDGGGGREQGGQRAEDEPEAELAQAASSSGGVRPPSTALKSSGVSGKASRHRRDSASLSGASTKRTSAPASR